MQASGRGAARRAPAFQPLDGLSFSPAVPPFPFIAIKYCLHYSTPQTVLQPLRAARRTVCPHFYAKMERNR